MKLKSTFKNWHKLGGGNTNRTKPHDLYSITACKHQYSGGLEITAEDYERRQIKFYLSPENTKVFLMNIDRFYHGKEVTREMYGLDA